MITSLGGKWVTADTVAARIARNYKSAEFDIYDVVEWCAECTNNIADFEGFERFNNVPVEIKNRKALLPCNIWRLLQVKGGWCNGCAVYNYENNGTFLLFEHNSLTNSPTLNTSPPKEGSMGILIDYIGIPIDPESGFPLVKEGHEEACYWYCLTKLLFEDFLAARIDITRWNFIQEMYGKYVQKAKSSFRYTSRDDMEKFTMAALNIVPKVRFPKHGMK